MRRPLLLTVAAAALSVAIAIPTLAGGIEIPMQGARAAAQADAFTAAPDDASAIFYNPAGLGQLKGTNLTVGVFGLFPQFNFHPDSGAQGQRMSLPSVMPHLYAESDFGTDKWRFGIGLNNVYGINEDYGDKGQLRLLANRAKLQVINVAPTVAYQIDDHWSVGAAFNVYFGDLTLQRNAMVAPPPVPEGDFRLRGRDEAFGVTPGIQWKIDDRNTIGAYYRTPFTFDFEGHSRLFVPGVPHIGPSPTHESLNFPQSVGLGYAVRASDNLKLEADVIWTDWHTVDQLRIHSPNPAFDGQTIPAHWKSGFTFRLGGEYHLDQHWTLRGGYAYGQNSVPASTFSPLVPDSNYHLFAAGGGYSAGRWSIDVSYQFIFREQRHIHGSVYSPLVDGTWDNQMHGVMLSLSTKL